ncbi:MAG: argininosuccinate lyase [Anaerolineae bacterium]|nr:argininosuccinate lyase [Anaerolineae bacterium]NUQ04330.1 argininosuccinate lyase [Anaerolineae bacterium]
MLWGGAFEAPTDEQVRRLNDSIGYDRRMYAEDIAGSIAYARAISTAGVITLQEAEQIVAGLERVLNEFERGEFQLQPADEDIHTAVERRLTEIVGAVGGKLHTGRSRNDQVATDWRLWTMHAIDQIVGQVLLLQRAILSQSEAHFETLMPGYTHLQPAQPVTAAHWLLSYFWMLVRDVERLDDARRRTAECPLGSGALAGTPFAIDRVALAQALGFVAPTRNSLDGVSDRDFVAEALFVLSLIGIHLSRLAEDIVIFSNPAFGFIRLDDRYSTGSSLMPQKRNADPMELARGKAGRLIGNLTGLLTVLKGLPTSYNKDLQEDKESLLDSVDTLMGLLPVVTAVVHTLKLNPERMQQALDESMLATDLADYLVKRGMPFREAHGVSGRVVRRAGELGVGLSRVPLEDLQALSPLFDADVATIFDFAASAARRKALGGTAPEAVQRQWADARQWIQSRGG